MLSCGLVEKIDIGQVNARNKFARKEKGLELEMYRREHLPGVESGKKA